MQRFDDVTDRDLEHLYGQLRPIASRLLAGEGSASLQTTELVHEIFLRMWDERELEDAMADPPAMLGLMAHRMQRILVDRARKKHAAKRGGGYKFVPFDDAIHMLHESPENLVWFDEVLSLMNEASDLAKPQRKVEITRMRVFLGLGEQETARALGISEPTVRRDWKRILAWLQARWQDFGRP